MRRALPPLPPVPGLGLTLRTLATFAALLALATGLAVLVSAVDGGGIDPASAARLLGPVVWGAAVALGVGSAARRGAWSGWIALGVSPRRLVLGLFVFTLLGAGSGLARSGAPSWGLPPPVDPGAAQWPAAEGWSTPDLRAWQSPPSTLGLVELWERSRADGPRGRRLGVDPAELTRRAGQGAAWGVALLLGVRAGANRRRRPGALALGGATAAGGVALWLLIAAVASAVQASTIT